MSHPYHHARSSAKKYGGMPEDYIKIHNFFDQTKQSIPDCRHRLILHNSFGIFLCEQVFGVTFTRESDGKEFPTRIIAEQHVLEDYGFIPSLDKVFETTTIAPWMLKGALQLSKEKE